MAGKIKNNRYLINAPAGSGKGQSSPERHEPAASAIWAGRTGSDAGKGDSARQDPRS